MRRTTKVAALATSVLATSAAVIVPAQAAPPTRHYEVTIALQSGGQPFTPPLLVTHRGSVGVFEVGEPAGLGVQEIAENGNLGVLAGSLGGTPGVADVVQAGAPLVPVGVPGDAAFDQSVTLSIEAERGARFLSWVSMLICTNDGFTGVDGLHLPPRVGQVVTRATAAYDAGTEVNTEDFADIVPPCQGLTLPAPVEMGTGTTNPDLAEGGVIAHHQGVVGGDDLDPSLHGWDTSAPVAQISVERVS